jgi:hypothetical protein
VEISKTCLDPKIQWAQFWNVWQNGLIRMVLYKVATPILWLRGRIQQ